MPDNIHKEPNPLTEKDIAPNSIEQGKGNFEVTPQAAAEDEKTGETTDATGAEPKPESGLDLNPEQPITGTVQELSGVDVIDKQAEPAVPSEEQQRENLLRMIHADRGEFNADATIRKLQERPLDTSG